MDPLLVRAKTIVPCSRDAVQNGVTFEALGRIDDAAMIVEGDRIAAIGRRKEIEFALKGRVVRQLDLRDCVIVPGFVDAHAHPLFSGDREPEPKLPAPDPDPEWDSHGVSPPPTPEPDEPEPDVFDPGLEPLPA